MTSVFLGLGSNENRERNLDAALAALQRRFGLLECSPIFESMPHGGGGQSYLNLVVKLETQLSAGQLKAELRRIEDDAGRIRSRPSPECALDIDILLMDGFVGDFDGVVLPHADILHRAYVLQPLALLAPEGIHPVLQISFAELWCRFAGPQNLKRVTG